MIALWIVLAAATGIAGGSGLRADDEAAAPAPESVPAVPESVPAAPEVAVPVAEIPAKKTTKRKGRIEKEAEGTEALGRFEADTVIKSRYTQNGEPLEVDPD